MSHGAQQTVPEQILSRKWSFAVLFLLIFAGTFYFFASLGAVPSALLPRTSQTPVVTPGGVDVVEEGELPVRIEIPEIGVAANVSNPSTTDIPALDRELLAGAVRYPGTGELGAKGNVLIFGHSSHLPVVHNQSYKAFNGIQNLKAGDPIYVYGEEKVYVYAVESVEESNTSTGEIRLDVSAAKLTLATCDNFGEKSDRFIVTATLVSTSNL